MVLPLLWSLFITLDLTHSSNVVKPVETTNIIWGSYYRPHWAGEIQITYTNPNGQEPGQIEIVNGIVLPIGTSGRPSAPTPWNGYPTGVAYDLDKGHVLALSNGGPDVSLNIVPQTAQWQRTGGWRRMEIAVFEYADSIYGWSTSGGPGIPHASEVNSWPTPSGCKVEFYVKCTEYDIYTGEPLYYEGSVQCGPEYFTFDIKPNEEANWNPYSPALTINLLSKDIEKSINYKMEQWEIALIVSAAIFLLCTAFICLVWKKSRKIQNTTPKDTQMSQLLTK